MSKYIESFLLMYPVAAWGMYVVGPWLHRTLTKYGVRGFNIDDE